MLENRKRLSDDTLFLVSLTLIIAVVIIFSFALLAPVSTAEMLGVVIAGIIVWGIAYLLANTVILQS